MGCPLAVLVWGETQAPVVRSLAAWWKGWRRSVTPHTAPSLSLTITVWTSPAADLWPSLLVWKMPTAVLSAGAPPPHVLSL